MKKIKNLFDKVFPVVPPIPSGIYHYQAPADAKKPYRLHLRIEPDGNGILIVNAHTVLHLNKTASDYAYHLVKGSSEKETSESMARRYNVSKESALQDYRAFTGRIETLIHTPDLDPVTYLDFERVTPYSKELIAPYRLDCAITYRVPSQTSATVAPQERVKRELIASEWKTILKKAWQAGIPQVVFTGGEPTLRPDLVELITEGERLGLVTGLLTDGLRLADKEYLETLLLSGLDHVMVLLNPDEKNFWKALELMLAEDLFVTVHITLTRENAKEIDSILDRLAKMGVRSLSISTDDVKLRPELKAMQTVAAHRQLSLVWDLPVPYSSYHPIVLEILDEKDQLVEGAGKAWLYVEPDGDVLPAQGINQVLGNLLTDEWEAIWKHRK